MNFIQQFFANLKPERFFIVCATVFGLTFLVITPPFQTPDEFNHFYRAYQISEGNFTAIKKDNRLGGELPLSLVNMSQPFRAMPRREYVKTNWSAIAKQSHVALLPEEKIFVDFPNTGMYSPVSYLPQSLSIFLLRICNLPPLYIFYGARLFTLFFWMACLFFIIRLLPFYKWLFTLFALLPMSVFTHMSLSADVMTNLLSFAVIAYSFNLAYRQTVFNTRHIIVFAVLGILLALAKVVYLPLILLFFLIPKNNFGNTFSYYKYVFILFSLSTAAAVLWSIGMKSLYTPYSLYNSDFREGPVMIMCLSPCANMQEQLQYILSHGWYVVNVVFSSIFYAFELYSRSYIGTFGWLDTGMATWMIVSAYSVIVFAAIGSGKNSITGWRFKPLLVIIFSIVWILIILSQLLTWSCVGCEFVYLVQGRYLIPILPLLFMLLYTPQWHIPQWILGFVISVFVWFSLVYCVFLLYNRYFYEYKVETTSLTCDAEEVIEQNYRTTGSLSSTIENGATQSSEKAYSGKYAAKISAKNPYTFTYRITDSHLGDSITVDVMRWGKIGGIMISADDHSFDSHYVVDPMEEDSAGWEHLHSKFMVPHNMNQEKISIFMYYKEGSDSSYFDDIKIVYRKLK